MYGAQTYEKTEQRANTSRGIRRMEWSRIKQKSVLHAIKLAIIVNNKSLG